MNHSINSQAFNQLKVTQNSVQDNYQTLEKTYKKQKREEDRQSGINPEEVEADIAWTDIIEQFEEDQKIHQDTSDKQKRKTENRAKCSKSRRHTKKIIRDLW